ncbi:MAG TPA: hypothetical protein VK061_00165 [Bacillota bacterium]|nr:hypothetical protein [Bacillota bacterium]
MGKQTYYKNLLKKVIDQVNNQEINTTEEAYQVLVGKLSNHYKTSEGTQEQPVTPSR